MNLYRVPLGPFLLLVALFSCSFTSLPLADAVPAETHGFAYHADDVTVPDDVDHVARAKLCRRPALKRLEACLAKSDIECSTICEKESKVEADSAFPSDTPPDPPPGLGARTRKAVPPSKTTCSSDLPYELARRPWNLRSKNLPAAVAIPEDEAAVAAAVECAIEADYLLTVKSGGHSYEGFSSGADHGYLLIDLRRLQKLEAFELPQSDGIRATDLESGKAVQAWSDDEALARFVRIGAGVQLGKFYYRLDQIRSPVRNNSYTLLAGHCPAVASGLFLNGGIGIFSRKFGVSTASLVHARLAFLNGTVGVAPPPLLAGIRGAGGGNFGIVTELTLKLKEAPSSLGVGRVMFNTTDYSMFLPRMWDWLRSLNALDHHDHRSGSPESSVAKCPEISDIADWHRDIGVQLFADASTVRMLLSLINPTRQKSAYLQDTVARLLKGIPALALQWDEGSLLDGYLKISDRFGIIGQNVSHLNFDLHPLKTIYAYVKKRSLIIPEDFVFTNEIAETLQRDLLSAPRGVQISLEVTGGALNDAPTADLANDAWIHRSSSAVFGIMAYSPEPLKPDQLAYGASRFESYRKMLKSIGAYQNYADADNPAWAEDYYGAMLPRLCDLAHEYDPDKRLKLSQSLISAAACAKKKPTVNCGHARELTAATSTGLSGNGL